MPHRVFSVQEVAEYLHVSINDIEELVKHKEIPFDQQGGRLVFRQRDIDAWASRRILGLSAEDLTRYHKTSSAKAHDLSAQHAIIPELVKPSFFEPELKAKTKGSVIREMVKLADRTELLNYPDELLTAIQEREQMCSTALGGGIALLHAKHHQPYMSEDSFLVLGRAIQPVPFGSPDGRTTDLFFLLCAQDDRTHLHLLARICMMCYHTSVLMDLRDADSAESMAAALIAAEVEVIKELTA
jgi:PTS system nitrogen regulatory IIA component